MLGTNGGGFFNANSAHPFENPTPLTNLLQMFLIFLIPAALTYTFGKMVRRHAAGLGDVRRDERAVPRRRVRLLTTSNKRGNPMLAKLRHRDRQRHASPAATWKARRRVSASPTPRCSPPSQPMRAAARSTACTTASRRSAAGAAVQHHDSAR